MTARTKTLARIGTIVLTLAIAATSASATAAIATPFHADREILDPSGEIQSYVPAADAGDMLPDVPLVDENGEGRSLRSGGEPTIVSFIETRCPDTRTCPLVTAKFGSMQRMLRGTHIRLMEITLDPAYDRPAILHRYAAKAGVSGADWLLATGRPRDIAEIGERLGIIGTSSGTADRGHTEAVAILSGDGMLQTLVDGNDWTPRDVVAQALDDAGLSSDPLRRAALVVFARVSAACGSSGAAGFPIAMALAVFGFLTLFFGAIALRIFAPAFIERS